MRIRNIKDKEKILTNSKYILKDYNLKGKWKEKFKNNNPICVEIGTGKCSFIYEMAYNNPNINYIGIERIDTVLALGIKEIEKRPHLNNLYLINYDALKVEEIFDHEIDTIYLNFSDPWPKKRHEKRRLTNFRFLKKYDIMFTSDSKIILKTDNESLFEYSIISLTKFGYKINDISLDLHKRVDYNNVMTEYEKKFSSKGCKIYMLNASKNVSK